MFDSVETAVGLSVKFNKPLLVVMGLKESSSEEEDWAVTLVTGILKSEGNFGTIPLVLKQNTVDSRNFVSVFPAVKCPAIYVILRTKFLLKLEQPLSKELLVQKLKDLNVTGSNPATGVTTPGTFSTSDTAASSADNASTSSASTSTSTVAHTNPPPPNSSVSASIASAHDTTNSATSSTPSSNSNSRSSASNSRDVPRAAVISHQSEVLKQKRDAMEERKRILRLVQNDKEERKAREQQRSALNADKPKPSLESKAEATTKARKPSSSSNTCALLIRLFDGTALKHTFENTAPLTVVRDWVESNRCDSGEPFTFYQNIPQRWFQSTDEDQTLKELGLSPSAALILKPVHNVANAHQRPSLSSYVTFDNLTHAVSTFLGIGFLPQPHPYDEDSQDEYTTSSSTPVPRAHSSSTNIPDPDVDMELVNESLRQRSPPSQSGSSENVEQ